MIFFVNEIVEASLYLAQGVIKRPFGLIVRMQMEIAVSRRRAGGIEREVRSESQTRASLPEVRPLRLPGSSEQENCDDSADSEQWPPDVRVQDRNLPAAPAPVKVRRRRVVVFLGVDAIYRTGVDAGGIFGSDAGFGDGISHGPPPPIRTYGMPVGENIQGQPK